MRLLTVLAACLVLAACNQGPKTDPNAKAAGGEVLPGTVSDAMIDLDRSTAEAPLAPHKAKPGDDADTDADADKAKAGDRKPAASAAAGDEPVAAPTPETKVAAKPSPKPAD